MADLIDFLPLFQVTEDDIRERMDIDANAGLTTADDAWIDTREGTFYWDVTQLVLQEQARIYDALTTEVVAASSPLFAWGEYLDNWAAVFQLERKAPVQAEGEVLFSGTAGTMMPAGLQVTAQQTDPDVDPPVYETTESGVISSVLAAPTGLSAAGSTASGSLASGTYYYTVTALDEYGTTVESSEQSATIASTGRITLTWNAVAGASHYKVWRGATTTNEKYLKTVYGPSHVDAGADTPTSEDPPGANTTGGKFRASVMAALAGADQDVSAGTLTVLLSPQAGISSVTNEDPIVGGADEESDEALRVRVLLEFEPGGAGNIADYKRWALGYPGVGRVKVVPVWSGAGTVRVSVMDASGDPVGASVVAGLQEYLDPAPGLGEGQAPIGHVVTVDTPSSLTVNVVAAITFQSGYSLDGAAATVACRSSIGAALSGYIDGLETDDDVVYNHALATFFAVRGVQDVTSLTLNGSAASVTVSSSQVATLGSVTLS